MSAVTGRNIESIVKDYSGKGYGDLRMTLQRRLLNVSARSEMNMINLLPISSTLWIYVKEVLTVQREFHREH